MSLADASAVSNGDEGQDVTQYSAVGGDSSLHCLLSPFVQPRPSATSNSESFLVLSDFAGRPIGVMGLCEWLDANMCNV